MNADPDRDYLAEALAIYKGRTMMSVQREHLVAVIEAFSGLHEIEDSGKRPTAPKSASDGGAIPASTSPKGYRERFTEEQKAAFTKAVFDNDYSGIDSLKRQGRWLSTSDAETNVFWSGEDAL